jgi:peptidoglycan/LPS O-acetylase OafA/YrhL
VAGKLDPPMWSLVVEVSFYAVLPLAGWLLVRAARRGRMVAACVGVAAVGVSWSAAGAALAWPQTAMSTLRWRPWTRRVASFPADRHIRPMPGVA